MCLAITLTGFCGGLIFSAIKRDKGVKDYGTLVAGHGGYAGSRGLALLLRAGVLLSHQVFLRGMNHHRSVCSAIWQWLSSALLHPLQIFRKHSPAAAHGELGNHTQCAGRRLRVLADSFPISINGAIVVPVDSYVQGVVLRSKRMAICALPFTRPLRLLRRNNALHIAIHRNNNGSINGE